MTITSQQLAYREIISKPLEGVNGGVVVDVGVVIDDFLVFSEDLLNLIIVNCNLLEQILTLAKKTYFVQIEIQLETFAKTLCSIVKLD